MQLLISLLLITETFAYKVVNLFCDCNENSLCYSTNLIDFKITENVKFNAKNCDNFDSNEIEEIQLSFLVDGIVRNLTEFKNLKVFKISHSNLNFFEVRSESLKILNIIESKVKEIPNLPNIEKIEKIFLPKNEILIVKNLENFRNLKILNLEANKIFYIPTDAFWLNSELTNLNLIKNQLTFLEPSTFSRNLKLIELSLNFNQLKFLHENQFAENRDLKILRLRKNQLKIVRRKMFEHNLKLEWIDLAENQIFFIETKSFGQKSLKFVNLKENQCIYEWFDVDRNREGMEKLIERNCHHWSGVRFLDYEE